MNVDVCEVDAGLREAALSGDPESSFLYARQWMNGGRPFSFEVFICLKKAADQNHKGACRLLAMCYCDNPIMSQTFHPNFDLMMEYFVKSVGAATHKRSLKSVIALPGLGLSVGEVVRILDFVRGSDAGSEMFCELLGVVGQAMHRGVIVCDGDDKKPDLLALFEHGVKSGSKNSGCAACGLAILYFIGFFGDENRTKCFSLFRASIFASYPKAEPYMALCCLRGIGMKVNRSQAFVHLNKALQVERVALEFANTFIAIGDSSPLSLFEETLESPQSQYITYKFITRLKCKSTHDPMALLRSAAAAHYPPAVRVLEAM